MKFNQSIINSQKNILFIQNDSGIVEANKRFLEFFNVKSLDEFNEKHTHISELFMEYENYFSLKNLNDNKKWVVKLNNAKNDEAYNVLIMDINCFEPKAFVIDVNSVEDSDSYVVTLTDITKITTKSKQFENKATYDALTKIYNRSKCNELMSEYYNIFKRYNTPLSFAIFDIDFFKKVNDTYGHIIGDETLITFAQTIDKATRDTDMFARWGGEEFVLLMPETNMDEAKIATNILRKLIENTHFKEVEEITCSIGVAQFQSNDTIDDILLRSDEALYEAKETGRNKVCTR